MTRFVLLSIAVVVGFTMLETASAAVGIDALIAKESLAGNGEAKPESETTNLFMTNTFVQAGFHKVLNHRHSRVKIRSFPLESRGPQSDGQFSAKAIPKN